MFIFDSKIIKKLKFERSICFSVIKYFIFDFTNARFLKVFQFFGLIFMVYIVFDVFRLGGKEICLFNVPNNSFYCLKLLNRSSFSSTCTEIANISSIEKNPYKLVDQYSTIINWEFFQYLSRELHNSSFPGVETYIEYVEAKSRLKPPNNIKLQSDLDHLVKSDIIDVPEFVYPLEIQPCIHTNPKSPSLFVAIISAPNNFENRNIIRQTWLNNLQTQSHLDFFSLTGFGFIIGLSTNQEIQTRIEAESQMHGDILQISMLDLYYDLTKKVVRLLNWLDNHCSLVNFVLKVDDDVYVNTKNLLTVLKSLNPSELSLYGSAGESIPIRDPGKNYISFENWPWTWYPPFILGGAILIPGRAIKPLKAASQTIPYFPFEDVYLSGLCSSKARIRVRFNSRFFIGLKTIYVEKPDPCHVYTSVTWLTNSLVQFNKSHLATNDFYSNVTKCIYRSNLEIVNSQNTFFFNFSNWNSLSKTLNWVENISD